MVQVFPRTTAVHQLQYIDKVVDVVVLQVVQVHGQCSSPTRSLTSLSLRRADPHGPGVSSDHCGSPVAIH